MSHEKAPRGTKRPQERPKWARNGAQNVPKWSRNGPQMVPRGFEISIRKEKPENLKNDDPPNENARF